MNKSSPILEVLNNKEGNYILPFFWLHGKGVDTVRELIGKIQEAGIHAVCIESRPHPDFVGPKWWEEVTAILEEAKSRNMKVWIFDDCHFPTGSVNGKVEVANNKLKRKFLIHREFDVEGPFEGYRIRINLEDGLAIRGKRIITKRPSRIVSCIMTEMKSAYEWNDLVVDITDSYEDGWLTVSVPEGKHRISIVLEQVGGVTGYENYINLFDKESVDLLIDNVYDPHYRNLKEYFGNTIAGFFSDEPGFYNFTPSSGFSMDLKIGSEMLLPWDEKIEKILIERMGKEVLTLLPYLWLDGSEIKREIRYHYMDIITSLYNQNFCHYLAEWCENHGVEYIGHIVEDNNSHARLGGSSGHYFRALDGQHMSGIDVVLQQIMPQMNGEHYSFVLTKVADGSFYYYGLAKLGTSLARLSEKTKGRAMCEIYGAYGWMEGLTLMKWLTDHMISRGINNYIPHAFTDLEFPDPDSPPHFYAHGKNPQYPYMKYLFEYLNRASHLISGGSASVKIAVLYHAEMEWLGETMMFHQIGKELMESQIDYDVVPIDELIKMNIDNGKLCGANGVKYNCLLIPVAEKYPTSVKEFILKNNDRGFPIYQVSEEKFAKPEILLPVISLEETVGIAKKHKCMDIIIKGKIPYLRHYHYIHEKENTEVFIFFNESVLEKVNTKIRLIGKETLDLYAYDPYENIVSKREDIRAGEVILELEPAEILYVIATKDKIPHEITETRLFVPEKENILFEITAENYDSPGEIRPICETSQLKDFFHWDPEFAGNIYYKTKLEKVEDRCFISLGQAYEVAEVFVNGKSAGVRITSPYEYDLSGLLNQEVNEVVVKVATSLVYAQCDPLSQNAVISPMGVIGPVTLWTEDKELGRNENGISKRVFMGRG